MKTQRKIMVAIDLSDYSKAILEYALNLARALRGELLIVNVINQRDIAAYEKIAQITSAFTAEDFVKMQKEERSKRIRELLDYSKWDDVPVEIVFCAGIPFEELIETAKEKDADLLVMGTRGRSYLRGLLPGSTAERVFRHCPIPVLSVRIQEQAMEGKEA